MSASLAIKAQYAIKGVVRDNFLCQKQVTRLSANERLPIELQLALSRRLLVRTLRTARKHISFYRNIDAGVTEDSVEEILREAFPIISKFELLNERSRFYPNGGRFYPWNIIGETSGTTGTPLRVVRDLRSVLMERAFLRRHWSWSGFVQGMRRATLRGDHVVSAHETRPPFWRYNSYDHQVVFSSLHLNPKTADLFIGQLEAWKPYILEAYPSRAYELAVYLEERGQSLSIPYVYTGSEPLSGTQRTLIEKRLGKVMDFYGMAERVAFAAECEQGNLHVNTDYSYVEIVDESGRRTDDYGFVVGTTFHNLLMPLVRYKLSDRTKWKRGTCNCGRTYPMIEPVSGREEDVILGSRGTDISALLHRVLKGVHTVRQTQIALVAPGRLEIRVVPGPKFDERQAQCLLRNLHDDVDPGIGAVVKAVEQIPTTRTGKQRWIVNECKLGANERGPRG